MKVDYQAQKYRTSWFSPAQCLAYYGVPYKIREIQIHWWDDPLKKPTHQGVVNYQSSKRTGSVNWVASGGRVTSMVPEKNCALTTQNGNPYGIKIECSPYGTNEDYETIGWLISEIWKRHGKIPLVPHKRYFKTACPGTLDLNRMTKVAEKYYKGDVMNRYPNSKDVNDYFKVWLKRAPTQTQVNHYIKNDWRKLIDDVFTEYKKGRDVTEKALRNEIANLKAKLAVQSQDTQNLNKLGESLQWFIARIGVK